MDVLLLLSFSAIFYAFVKKGLAFGRTFVSRVVACSSVHLRVFFLSRSPFLFVGKAIVVCRKSNQFHEDNEIMIVKS